MHVCAGAFRNSLMRYFSFPTRMHRWQFSPLNASSQTPKSLWRKWIPIDFLIIFTFARLDSLTSRFLISRSKFPFLFRAKSIGDWGNTFHPKMKINRWKYIFLLRRRAFSENALLRSRKIYFHLHFIKC